jgi:hypothetical protein
MNEDPLYMKHCWFICNKFSLVKINGIFDGDLPVLTRIKIAIFSFLRKFTQQGPVDREMQRDEEVARNVSRIDLGIIRNVNGMLMEPVGPGLLISRRRYFLNNRDRRRIIGNFSVTGIPRIMPGQMGIVNNFLQSMNLRNIDDLIRMFRRNNRIHRNTTLTSERSRRPWDETLHRRSRVNGMVNQLWQLQQNRNVSDFMMPRRELKEQVIKIIKDNGFSPIPVERRLQQFELFPVRRQRQTQPSPRNNTIMHHNIPNVSGKRTIVRGLEPPVSDVDKRFLVEVNIELYEKMEETIDMYNYGISLADDGLNPLTNFYEADFEKNITNLINDHFDSKDKLDGEVLVEYLSYSAKKINEFNELFEEEIDEFVKVRNRDKKLNKYKSIKNYANVHDRHRLGHVADENMSNIKVATKEQIAKRRRDHLREKLIRRYEKAKAFDSLTGPDLSKHLISNMPGLNDTFAGMSSFFGNMFGP